MLIQQLRELERDGIVVRKIYPQVLPKVEYSLTKWGEAMCPTLDSLLEWAAARPMTVWSWPTTDIEPSALRKLGFICALATSLSADSHTSQRFSAM